MAQFDQGGDCDCGLQRVCDCGIGQADGSKPKKKPMGHYDTCREGNCGRCGQALEWCSCPTVIMTNPGDKPGSRYRTPKMDKCDAYDFKAKTQPVRNPDELSEVIGFLLIHEEYRLADLVHHARKTLRTLV